MSLDAAALDDYARRYYLSEVDDLDIEEQELSAHPPSSARTASSTPA